MQKLVLSLSVWLAATAVQAQALPPEVEAALTKAKLPRDAVSMLVLDAQGKNEPRLAHRAQVPVNPASVMKLVTTYAALDLLGPAFNWKTPVFIEGAVQGGVLTGNLYIKGAGDPKLVAERLWLLLKRVQGLGIKTISGDIVLDRSAFETVEVNPADFDGEPLRPYNAAPDALLINFKSMVMSFTPDRLSNGNSNIASIAYDLPLAGVQMQTSVPLGAGRCDDWRGALKADFSDPLQVRFLGNYPAACGERVWPVAYAEPRAHAARAVEGLWRELGGKLGGKVREGKVPPALKPVLESQSASLAETIRDINKFSNNVMAQQVFLTLSLQTKNLGTLEGSREVLRAWWKERLGEADAPALDNGSGLSRSERISAQGLARLLQHAWASPVMPELMSSLPIAGVDGTLRNRKTGAAQGSAHLKTGSLSNVAAVAGYVHGLSGKRYVLVAIANHPNASAAREAFDALLNWTAKDQ